MTIEYDARDLRNAADKLRRLRSGPGIVERDDYLDTRGRDGELAKRNLETLGHTADIYLAFSEKASRELEGMTKLLRSPVGKAASHAGSLLIGFAFDWALEQLKSDVLKASELVNKAGDTLGDAEKRYISAKALAVKVLSEPQWYANADEADRGLVNAMDNLKQKVRSVEEAAGLLCQQRDTLSALQSATDKWQQELHAEEARLPVAREALAFLAKNYSSIRQE